MSKENYPERQFSETGNPYARIEAGLLKFTNYAALMYILIIQYGEKYVKENHSFFRYFFTDYRHMIFNMLRKTFLIACPFPLR